jgi:hypothetical protein
MPRSCILAAVSALSTVTALVLLTAAVSIRPAAPVSITSNDGTSRRAVERFYEAVNAVIATGDPGPLATVLAQDFAEPDEAGVLRPGRAPLERSLLALHATVPNLRLETEQVVGDGDRVVAIVRPRGVEGATVFGLTLIDRDWWSPVEVFRVAGALVVERAAISRRPALLEPLPQAPVEPSAPARGSIAVLHVSLEADGRHRAPAADGLRLLVVEAGALEVTVETNGDLAAVPPSYSASLAAGEQLVMDGMATGSSYVAHNVGPKPAVFFEVMVAKSNGSRDAASPYAETAGSGDSASGQGASLTPGPAELAIGRATLAPGGRLAWAGPVGPVLLVVEHGELELRADETVFVWVRRDTGHSSSSPIVTLAAGDGGMLAPGADAELRNAGDGPLDLLIVTLLGPSAEPALR